MKIYQGIRTEQGCKVTVRDNDGPPRPLDLRRDLRNHSLEAEWGYGGSGPAQLALALLADVLGDDEQALDHYQDLKFRAIGRLPHQEWTLTEQDIRDKLAEIQRGARSRGGGPG